MGPKAIVVAALLMVNQAEASFGTATTSPDFDVASSLRNGAVSTATTSGFYVFENTSTDAELGPFPAYYIRISDRRGTIPRA